MAIKMIPETYDSASTILSQTKETMNKIISEISNVKNSLDSKVSAYVESDLKKITSGLDDINLSSYKMSISIKEKADEFRRVENRANGSLTNIGVVTNEPKDLTLDKQLSESTKENIEEEAAPFANVANVATSILDTLAGTVEDVGGFLLETIKKTGASVANTAVGLVQGVAELGEAIVDTGAILCSVIATPFTALGDGIQWINGKITGNENWNSVTADLWTESMDFVGTKHVTDAFDSFHQNNVIGKWLDANAYSPFKSTGAVYQIADGVGYIGGIIALTLVTMGLGGAAVGAGAAGSSGTVATINLGNVATVSVTKQAITSGIVATTAGFGKNTQNAWSDGATLVEGLTYGLAKGSWEGLEMFLGASINTLRFPSLLGLKGQLLTTGSHVALDTIDGASAGVIDPLMQMIYNPTESNIEQIMYQVNYDENGNQISDKKWEDLTVTEKYKALFEYNGGWKNVGIQALSAGAISFLTEIPDIIGSLNNKSIVKVDKDPTIMDDTSSTGTIEIEPPRANVNGLKGNYIPDTTPQINNRDVFDILNELELYYKTELTTFEEGLDIIETYPLFTEEDIFKIVQTKTGLDTDAILPVYEAVKKQIDAIPSDERVLGRTAATISSGSTTSAMEPSNIEQLGLTSAHVLNKYKGQLRDISNRFNISIPEAKVLLDKKVQELVSTSDFGTRQGIEVLEKILDTDGYMKTLFEVGTSEGYPNKIARKRVEMDVLKVPDNIDVLDRPLYGMCIPNVETTSDADLSKYINFGPGAGYGRSDGCILIFDKSKVIDNATVTIGDSLDYQTRLTATSAANPRYNGGHLGFLRGIQTPEELQTSQLQDIFTRGDEYLEVQLHGHDSHSIDNIKEVIFAGDKKPSPELIQKLEARGIKWRII